jgi:hypothetical protein
MRKSVFWGLILASTLPALVGCSQHASTVRGQSPQDCPPGAQPHQGGYGTGSYTGWERGCPCHGDGGMEMESGANHRYVEPRYLQYPNQPDVPAVYQYPYYTHKGPDCFFKQ